MKTSYRACKYPDTADVGPAGIAKTPYLQGRAGAGCQDRSRNEGESRGRNGRGGGENMPRWDDKRIRELKARIYEPVIEELLDNHNYAIEKLAGWCLQLCEVVEELQQRIEALEKEKAV